MIGANGFAWVRDGFGLFHAAPLRWALLSVAVGLVVAGVGMVPIAGPIVLLLVMPGLVAAFVLGAEELHAGEGLELSVLIRVWSGKAGSFLKLGLVQFLASLSAAMLCATAYSMEDMALFGAALAGNLVLAGLFGLATVNLAMLPVTAGQAITAAAVMAWRQSLDLVVVAALMGVFTAVAIYTVVGALLILPVSCAVGYLVVRDLTGLD
jgi:hypothetical protein